MPGASSLPAALTGFFAAPVADFLGAVGSQAVDRQVRRGMVERDHPALSISRSSFYHEPGGETEQNLGLMRLIDRQFLDTPFHGVRQMTWRLRNEEHGVNQKRIRRLMRVMRLMPIHQKPNTGTPRKGHKIYPYLLGGLRVDRPGQVWCADITDLPMRRGFLWWPSWTGSRARCWHGASPIRSRPTSASRR